MSVCTFFGHGECHGLNETALRNTLERLIQDGVDDFLVGQQGQFDSAVQRVLCSLRERYPHIRCSVVLSHVPTEERHRAERGFETVCPDGVEDAHPKYAIAHRNRWMVEHAQYCVCFIEHPWGGAYTFAKLARRKHLTVLNLGSGEI